VRERPTDAAAGDHRPCAGAPALVRVEVTPGARHDPDRATPDRPRRHEAPRGRRDGRRRRRGGQTVPRARPGAGGRDRRRDGPGGGPGGGRAGPGGDRGDRVRGLRGQGGQELRGHRVPLRLPARQEVGGRHRRGRRAQHRPRRRADRGGAGDHAGDQPDLHRALQGDRGGQDPQLGDLPALAVRRPLLPAGRGDPPRGGRGGRHAPGRAAGDPGRRARGDALPLQAPGRGLHLGDRRPEDRGAGQRGRQARPQRRPRQRTHLHPPLRGHPGRGPR